MVGDRRRRQRQDVSQAAEVAVAIVDQMPQQLETGWMREGLAHARKVIDIDLRGARARNSWGTAGLRHGAHSLFDEQRIDTMPRSCQSL